MTDELAVRKEDGRTTIVPVAVLVEAVTAEFLEYLNSSFVSDVVFYPEQLRGVSEDAIRRALSAAAPSGVGETPPTNDQLD